MYRANRALHVRWETRFFPIPDAVVRNLHTLAESSQRLSDSSKSKYPDIEWRNIAAFRNVIVPDYLGIDLDQIWDIVGGDLPSLREKVKVWKIFPESSLTGTFQSAFSYPLVSIHHA